MTSRVGQYCISVADLEKSAAFYRDVLGLQEQQRISIPGAEEIILGAEGSDGKIQLAQRDDVVPPIDHGNALWKLYLYCDDIEGICREVEACGCKVVSAPQRLEQWPVIVAFITDLDGYSIEVIERVKD
ncbi:VOC family protein [Haliea sp. E1-2-M8]|uniref:VOC family protein n=1 Tax=Haliea sp. E1-2-M8 TaxID=3064706 RepID=UPI00272720E7|nr:VOC family protein [Haliea sp. E1-2-M8]MDO8863147.1 VOC family protein [Haliea sp. E1-2-M8]